MIQRIQTLFLLLAAAAGFSLLAMPFASSAQEIAASSLFSDQTFNVNDSIAILVLFALAGALSLASIFLYKNRPIQLKLTRIAIFVNLVGIVVSTVLFIQDKANQGNEEIQYGFGVGMPLLFVLFGALAIKAISKDEKLVRSMDRLR